MSNECEMGTKLPADGGPCPRCGARSDQNCGPWVTSIGARAEAAEAEVARLNGRVVALETKLDIARSRWQTLVNVVAGAWNNGLVPGSDHEAVTWAIREIKARAALQEDGET